MAKDKARWGDFVYNAFDDLEDHLKNYEHGEEPSLSQAFGKDYMLYAKQSRAWIRDGAVNYGLWTKDDTEHIIEKIREYEVTDFNLEYPFIFFQERVLFHYRGCSVGDRLLKEWNTY